MSTEELRLFDDDAPTSSGDKARLISTDAEQAVKEVAKKVGATSGKVLRSAAKRAADVAARMQDGNWVSDPTARAAATSDPAATPHHRVGGRENGRFNGAGWKGIAFALVGAIAIVLGAALGGAFSKGESQKASAGAIQEQHAGDSIANIQDSPPTLPTAEACTKSLGAANAFESQRAAGKAQDPVLNSKWSTFIFACSKRGHYVRATSGGPLVVPSAQPTSSTTSVDPNAPHLSAPPQWEAVGLMPLQVQARGEAGCRNEFVTETKVFAKLKGPDGDLLYPSEIPWRAQIQRCLSAGYLMQSRDGSQLVLPNRPRLTSQAAERPAEPVAVAVAADVKPVEPLARAPADPAAAEPVTAEQPVYPPLPSKTASGTCQLDLVVKTLRAVNVKSEKAALTEEEKRWVGFGYDCLASGYLGNGFTVPKTKSAGEAYGPEKVRASAVPARAAAALAQPVALAPPVPSLGTPTCMISGTVLSQDGGKPLAGAMVQISGAGAAGGRAVATTDAAGAFKVDGAIRLPNAVPLALSVSASKHNPQQTTPMWTCSQPLPAITLETCNAFSCALRKALQQPGR